MFSLFLADLASAIILINAFNTLLYSKCGFFAAVSVLAQVRGGWRWLQHSCSRAASAGDERGMEATVRYFAWWWPQTQVKADFQHQRWDCPSHVPLWEQTGAARAPSVIAVSPSGLGTLALCPHPKLYSSQWLPISQNQSLFASLLKNTTVLIEVFILGRRRMHRLRFILSCFRHTKTRCPVYDTHWRTNNQFRREWFFLSLNWWASWRCWPSLDPEDELQQAAQVLVWWEFRVDPVNPIHWIRPSSIINVYASLWKTVRKIAWLIAPDTHWPAGKLPEACNLLVSFPSFLPSFAQHYIFVLFRPFWHLLLQSICRSPPTPRIASVCPELSSAPRAWRCSPTCIELTPGPKTQRPGAGASVSSQVTCPQE